MSLIFRFPFRYGGPTTNASVVTFTLWTQSTAGAQSWNAQSPTMRRFEPIFPEADTGPQWIQDTDVVS